MPRSYGKDTGPDEPDGGIDPAAAHPDAEGHGIKVRPATDGGDVDGLGTRPISPEPHSRWNAKEDAPDDPAGEDTEGHLRR